MALKQFTRRYSDTIDGWLVVYKDWPCFATDGHNSRIYKRQNSISTKKDVEKWFNDYPNTVYFKSLQQQGVFFFFQSNDDLTYFKMRF